MKPKVIVVGAGIGGLSAAVELLSQGMAVLVVEKNHQPGGRAGECEEGGYRWPNGATAVLDPAKLIAPFTAAGKPWGEYFSIERLKMPFRWQQDRAVHFWADDLEVMLERLASHSAQAAEGYLDYLADAKGRYDLSDQYERYGRGRYETAGKIFRAYTWERDLAQWLTFMAAYPGGAMKDIPARAAWQPAVAQLFGVWRITGGMAAYARALARLIVEMGGELRFDEPAEEIVVAGERAVGVKTEQGLYLADGVVSDVDYHYALQKLLPMQVEDAYQRAEEDYHHSCGIVALYLLTEKSYSRLSEHNMLSGRQLTGELQAACRGKSLRRPALYLYQAPRGEGNLQQLVVYARVPNAYLQPRVWTARQKSRMVKRIMAVLTKTEELEKLPEDVRAMGLATPEDFKRRYHASGGAAFGLAGDERLWQSPNIAGLYFVGDSVSGGAGVHRVLAHSARTAAEITRTLAVQRA